MCANLWIEKVRNQMEVKYREPFKMAISKRNSLPKSVNCRQAAQKNVERYFHLLYGRGFYSDPGGFISVLHPIGLTWRGDVLKLCSEQQLLTPQRLLEFRNMLMRSPYRLPSAAIIRSHQFIVAKSGTTIMHWHRHYTGRFNSLVTFIDEAITLNSPICCAF